METSEPNPTASLVTMAGGRPAPGMQLPVTDAPLESSYEAAPLERRLIIPVFPEHKPSPSPKAEAPLPHLQEAWHHFKSTYLL